MAQYEPFDDGVETKGETLLVIEEALARFSEEYLETAREALAEYGIEDPAPDEWYPQEAELNALETIADELDPHLMDRIGEQIPDLADWPEDISTAEEGLRSIDRAYQMNVRGGEIGSYQFEKVDEDTGRMICENPYPCRFDRGLIRAVAQEYAPFEAFVFVEEVGSECRRRGGEICTYRVHI